jgi:hypothetical protein
VVGGSRLMFDCHVVFSDAILAHFLGVSASGSRLMFDCHVVFFSDDGFKLKIL